MAETLATVSNSYDNAHEVKKGDPRIDGPYLDDIRASEAEARRKQREEEMNAAWEAREKEAASEKKEESKEKKDSPKAVKKAVAKKAATAKKAAKKAVK